MTAPADEKSTQADTIQPCRFEPRDTQAENELIAERLLGWKQYKTAASIWWEPTLGKRQFFTPTFTTWAERGLIIDALQKQWPLSKEALRDIGSTILMGALTEQDVRSIALSYLRSLER